MKVERWSGHEAPTEAALRERLEGDGYSVYAWTDDPGATYPPHAHADDQSHCVVRGRLALTVRGVEHVLGPGDRDYDEGDRGGDDRGGPDRYDDRDDGSDRGDRYDDRR